MEPSRNDEPLPASGGPGADLEVFFCDLCNTSVPARDLELGVAKRVKGRLLGACCTKELLASAPSGEGRSYLPLATVVLLAAIAGATVFLDRRIGDEIAGIGSAIGRQVEAGLARHSERLGNIEARVASSAEKTDLSGMSERLTEVQTRLGAVADKAEVANAQADALKQNFGKIQEAWSESQKAQEESSRRFEGSLRAIGDDLAALKAMPRSAAPSGESKPSSGDAGMPPAQPAPSGLPRELQHHVDSLTDSDAGVRFQAVAALVDSKNPEVREPILRLVKDPDVFVRRQVFEGLRSFKHSASVEALLVGLSDPVEIVRHSAHQSLVALLGPKVVFDPNGTKEARGNAVRKWREYWDDNKKSFGS